MPLDALTELPLDCEERVALGPLDFCGGTAHGLPLGYSNLLTLTLTSTGRLWRRMFDGAGSGQPLGSDLLAPGRRGLPRVLVAEGEGGGEGGLAGEVTKEKSEKEKGHSS